MGIVAACSSEDPSRRTLDDGSSSSGSGGAPLLSDGVGSDQGNGINDDLTEQPPTANCGDGILDKDEACDDGNRESDDGCGGNCRYIESGFICPVPGELCRPFARCGDGVVVFPEQCDDANLDADDGCSATCRIEIGYKCSGSPSVCEETTCGDGKIEGAETCDDGNDIPFDGCDQRCQAEPTCTDKGCTSACGDGIVMGDEECDDGNALNGDGCSATCKIEAGYKCEQASPCEQVGEHCAIRLPVVYRDFQSSHSDFERDCDGYVAGIPQQRLDALGKPVLSSPKPTNACIDSANSYRQWFGAASGSYATILESIVLFPDGDGGFVNRHGPSGEQWAKPPVYSNLRWCGSVADGCTQCGFNPATETCWTTNIPQGCCGSCSCAGSVTQDFVDGTPLFFPIDDHPDALSGRSLARLPAKIYGDGNTYPNDPSGKPRNFHFTSEIAYWFKYEAGSTPTLTFIGDDDVWVFVNRRLAVDLGGTHEPLEGSFSIAANGNITLVSNGTTSNSNTTNFGLDDGGVYEIKVFHAERKTDGSSFQLTLNGFNTSRSECAGTCGDGVIVAGEECDDGTENNIGGYNRCNPDCTLGGYCGDGIKQEHEQCDDADPEAPLGCRGCRVIVVR